MEFVAKYWMEFAFGIISTSLLAGARYTYNRLKAQSNGVQALLRDRIVQAYYHYAEHEEITQHGLEAVESMYKEYHNLGGNGTVTKLVNDMRDFKVVEQRRKGQLYEN